MAKLLTQDRWAGPDSLGGVLRDRLGDDYLIVDHPTVQGVALEAVIVGPQGLFVLYTRDWQGEIRPAGQGPWQAHLESGETIEHPSPLAEVSRAGRALRAFLAEEFPQLQPAIHHLLVLTEAGDGPAATQENGITLVTSDDLADVLSGAATPAPAALADEATREELADALLKRRLTANQRAAQPFVFRSGGFFGSGKKAWSLQEVARHLDRHPEDGIYHLRNGTLAQWLHEQGADHLARLADEVVQGRDANPRIMLERFQIGTELVPRPRISVKPRSLWLGHVLAGQSCSHQLRLRKARSRGYLFGGLETSDPWLRVEPSTFSGDTVRVVVSADTDTLLIGEVPQQAELRIECSASEEPLAVPVRFRVVGIPSLVDRYLIRPLVGLLSMGLIGSVLGWLLGRALANLGSPLAVSLFSMSTPATWALLIGVIWALLGGLRGLAQPLAWPVLYAGRRCLLRVGVWVITLALVALAVLWAWQQMDAGRGLPSTQSLRLPLILTAAVLAVVPAVLGELWSMRAARRSTVLAEQQPLLRPGLLIAIALVLALALGIAIRLGVPAWQNADANSLVSSLEQWIQDGFGQLETRLGELVDDLILRWFER